MKTSDCFSSSDDKSNFNEDIVFSFTEPWLFKKRFCSQNQRTEVSDASSLDSLSHVFILQQVFTKGPLQVKLPAWKWNMNLNKTVSFLKELAA